MRLLLLCIISVLMISSCYGQEVLVSPFGFEIIPQFGIPTITGENTESLERSLPTGALVLLCGTSLTKRFWIESGLQLGFARLGQQTIERQGDGSPMQEIIRTVNATVSWTQIGVPVMLKWNPVTDVGLYFKVGGRLLFNFSGNTSGELEEPDLPGGQDPTIFPAGDVDLPAAHTILEGGIGYQFVGGDGRFSYVELSVGRVLGDAIEHAGRLGPSNRLNYLDTASLMMLNFTVGFRFGR